MARTRVYNGNIAVFSNSRYWQNERPYYYDDFSASSVGCSLRQLASTATNCVEVRRASDDTTQDIGFSNGNLDVTSLESFCSGTDGFVRTWYGQNGSWDYRQSVNSRQAKIVDNGSVLTLNGKPCINFSTNMSTELSNNMITTGGEGIYNNDAYTLFMVGAFNNPAGSSNVFAPGTTIQDGMFAYKRGVMFGTRNSVYNFNYGGYDINRPTNISVTTDQKIYATTMNTFDEKDSYLYINNDSEIDFVDGANFLYGSSNSVLAPDGDIDLQEIVVYQNFGVANPTPISQITNRVNNMNNYWNVY